MDSSLGRGFYEVFSSSKEIVNNNQRHLFCNMLDLLSNTTKSTPPALIAKILTVDNLVPFWLEDILPFVFDKDASIQGSAVSALEQGLLILDIGQVHNHRNWNNIKNVIVKDYASRLHELREGRSQYWHRIWCILIRLLDREILKSASTINLFLSIVELGFRSLDNSVRAEAFTCWHLLIKIFATHNQLSSPKRLKLVCIPLKSSQSKTPYVAAVKLRIWWYLITCLGEQIEENFENVVEAFLIFCLGSELKSTTGVAHQYVSMREPALTCLAAIVTTERDEFLLRLLREYELEACSRFQINSNITEKYWKSILYAVLEATSLIIESDKQSDLEQRLLSVIIKSSITLIINYDMAPLYEYFFTGLMQITTKSSRPISIVTNAIATEGLRFSRSLSDYDNYVKTLQSLIKLLTSARDCVDPSKIHQCIIQISSLDAFITKRISWCAVAAIAEYFFKMPNDEGFEYFEVKFLIWRHISSEMVNNIRNNTFGRTVEEFSDVLISWSLWPLRTIMEFTGRRKNSIFDEHFYSVWHNLLQLTENNNGRLQHLAEVGEVLSAISKCGYEWAIFVQLLNVYVDEVIKHDSRSFSKYYEQILSILCEVMQKNLPQKEKEKLLTIIRCILHNLKTSEYISLLEPIKATLKHAIKSSSKGAIDSKAFEEWKHSVINIIRSSADKNSTSQLTDLFKDDVYVIIPSVWSLKPEKLTDRQKERFAEKNSIPALYNDMSQSQDTLIKPWTPKKIVIAKEDQNEIIIESSNTHQTALNENISADFQESPTSNMPNNILETATNKNKVVSLLTPLCPNKENVQDLPNSTTDKLSCKDRTDTDRNHNMQKVGTGGKKLKQMQHTDEETMMNPKTVHVLSRESLQGSLKHPPEDHSKDQLSEVRHDNQLNCIEGKTVELPNSSSGIETFKEISPKKVSTRNALLLSPPDRKLTNNNSSPKLRPKPPAHLQGRGAQLINMIRNKKSEPQLPQTPMPRLFVSKNDSMDRSGLDMDMFGMDNTSTPLQSKDILTFSKRLPSPSASPSTSILKRNLRRDSLEDIAMESPACKKKRVSFHDPPVSVTKEYIKHNDENKAKPKRAACRVLPCRHLCHSQCAETLLMATPKLCAICRASIDDTEDIERSIYKSYSLMDRERIVNAANKGEDWPTLAKSLGIAYKTAYTWAVSGRLEKQSSGGKKPRKLTADQVEQVLSWLEGNCSLTLRQIQAKILTSFNMSVSLTTINTMKHVHTQPIASNSPQNKEKRSQYVTQLITYIQAGKQLIYVDETASRGANVHLIGAIAASAVVCLDRRRGSFTAPSFRGWILTVMEKWRDLGNNLSDMVIICDNAPCHSSIEAAVEECRMGWPPYFAWDHTRQCLTRLRRYGPKSNL